MRRSLKVMVRAAAVGSACTLAVGVASTANAAVAAPLRGGDGSDAWGTVVKNGPCTQATAWANRLKGVGGVVNATLFEVHSPPTPQAPESAGGGSKIIKTPVGNGSAYALRAMAEKLPAGEGAAAGGEAVPTPCAAYADATFGSVDVGLPYVPNPAPGGVQLSPIGVHIEAPTIEAKVTPGGPVELTGGAAAGYISALGKKVVNIPKLWPVNFGVRIPQDRSQPELGSVMTNEQVTTDAEGMPTLDETGHYRFDPAAGSGYVNAIHVSLLGTSAGDFTWGHAAVLRKS